jgi:hypothetical protein
MIHSFSEVMLVNGNMNVCFQEDNKMRRIILSKGSQALEDYQSIEDATIKGNIMAMKKKYYFKANANNKSIFRPIDKSLMIDIL